MPRTKKEITPEEEKAIVSEIMSQKSVSPEEIKKVNDSIDEEEMEKIRTSTNPRGKFVCVEIKGMYRVMNKRQQWVSPLTTLNIASKLCADMNMKDPEQKAGNVSSVKKEGVWIEN